MKNEESVEHLPEKDPNSGSDTEPFVERVELGTEQRRRKEIEFWNSDRIDITTNLTSFCIHLVIAWKELVCFF